MTIRETLSTMRAVGTRFLLAKDDRVFADPRTAELNEFLKTNYREVQELLREEREIIARERLIDLAADLGIDSLAAVPDEHESAAQTAPTPSEEPFVRVVRVLLG